jgi:orotidine-5'-phosphate decarboxylase
MTSHGSLAPKDRLIVALDFSERAGALRLVDTLGDAVSYYKVGYELFLAEGWPLVDELCARGGRVFLDLKMDDIPETITRAVRFIASKPGVRLLTIHGGAKTAVAAKAGKGDSPLKLLQVTLLTSMGEPDLHNMGLVGDGFKFASVPDYVAWRAETALANGADGLIASGQEAAMLRARCGAQFTLVCPGIRPGGDAIGDHKRAITPADAIRDGADHLVVGRPIRDAADPRAKAQTVIREIEDGLRARAK